MKRIRIDPACYPVLCLWILLFPVKWLFFWLLAALVHEICHMISVKTVGGKISSIRVGPFGAQIHAQLDKPWQELLCVAAGPVGGAMPVLLLRAIPELAICCAALSVYNLLPLFPLDGGRMLSILTAGNNTLRKALENAVIIGLMAAGIAAAVYFRLGLLPVIFIFSVCLRHKIILAKKAPGEYNVHRYFL